ncbi:hypothetical protein D9611_004875 [Ephemerocybe angulata]|uniref:CTLH domain-containing protein n=1 Tax=Ephemerocybe angulata TaxID=980116 RepID=A0A8H5EXB6_9AGAR|nr:hypothetical protein D9611_004875 [Tulosesus angulatus]
MRLVQSDRDSILSASPDVSDEAGPSNGHDGVASTNGRTNGHSYSALTNGASTGAGGLSKNGKGIARVNLPGTTISEDSSIDREEFVRLVIQSLRDVGYIESAATLEAESGYTMETLEVTQFRQYILDGVWSKAETALRHLYIEEPESLLDARFLINEQKYLEFLEAGKTTAALHVLRNELAPLNVDPDHLHTLSSLIMCSEPEDLRRRADWDGAAGLSRQRLLNTLHNYIPSSVMIPQKRFPTLIQQALEYQRHQCLYHNLPPDVTNFSLYSDHFCTNGEFPTTTTTILEIHRDEVWNIEWSHDGQYLATASKDKSAIIWRVGDSGSSSGDWSPHLVLSDHQYAVGALSWSLDDSVLLTTADQIIKMWNTKTGVCIRTLEERHQETVSSIVWLADGSGFISAGLDRKIIHWNADGTVKQDWGLTTIRITDMALTPDGTRLVAVGMEHATPDVTPSRGSQPVELVGANPVVTLGSPKGGNRMVIFDLTSKHALMSIRMEGELTSVKVSQNSQYALINHAPDVIYLYDIRNGRLSGKYIGQQQGRHIIRSCFGGANGTFIISGSEDGNVYVWHRETGTLLEVLPGHGEGSVNAVSWNPTNNRMFASCSDDCTIRIWEAPELATLETRTHRVDGFGITIPNGKGKGKLRGQPWDDHIDSTLSAEVRGPGLSLGQ